MQFTNHLLAAIGVALLYMSATVTPAHAIGAAGALNAAATAAVAGAGVGYAATAADDDDD